MSTSGAGRVFGVVGMMGTEEGWMSFLPGIPLVLSVRRTHARPNLNPKPAKKLPRLFIAPCHVAKFIHSVCFSPTGVILYAHTSVGPELTWCLHSSTR